MLPIGWREWPATARRLFRFREDRLLPYPPFPETLLETEAKALAQVGIASMRYDKRGSGASQGDIRMAGFDDLVADAHAALDHIRSLAQIDNTRIGILGQSEGAAVTLCVASARRDLSFYVWQSGFVQPTRELAQFQLRGLQSTPSDDLSQMRSVAPYLYWETLQYESILASALAGDATFVIGDPAWSLELGLDYYRQAAALDLPQRLRELSVPVLIVHGANDSVVPPANAQMAADILRKSGTVEVTISILPGLDHSLNPAGAPPQELEGKKLILPDRAAVDLVISWIAAHVGLGSQEEP